MTPAATMLQRLRRWCRFRLSTLFFLLSATCLALVWYVIHRDIENARGKYEWAVQAREISVITHEELCEASRAVREAECRMPFYSRRAAGAKHFARMQRLKLETIYSLPETCGVGSDEAIRIVDTLDRYCEEADEWLVRQDGYQPQRSESKEERIYWAPYSDEIRIALNPYSLKRLEVSHNR